MTNRVYVACSDQVCVIDGATNTMIGNPIDAARGPVGIAVNPATNRIYVPSYIDHTVTVIDGRTNTVVGSPIPVQMNPYGVAVNPSTNRVYVTNQGSSSVSVIDGATNTVVGYPIAVGRYPQGIAVDEVTNRVYVANVSSGSVTVIDGATGIPTDARLPVGVGPWGIGVNPASHRVYTANYYGDSVSVLHVPFALDAGTAPLGRSITATWSSLFGPNGADYIGLYEPSAPSTSPLSRVFTNGTASSGGAGVVDGSVSLPIPAGLATGSYEARLISGSSGTVFGQAAVTVAGPPTAVADSYTGGAARTLTVPAPGVLANDTDADSPTLQATVVTSSAFGTLVLQPNGAFSYVPGPGFAGADSFTYRATDQTGLSATATVTMTVAAVPAAALDTYTVNHGSVLNVAAPGVLTNDTDADSPSLQASVVTDPANGTLSLQPSGAFSYTPRQGFVGADRFTYRVTDQTGLSTTGTATITVSPVACGPRPTVRTDSRVVDGALQVTVSTAGTDGPTNNRLKELRFAAPVNGRVEVAGQSHTDAFAYAVPTATDRVSFAVHRVTPGQATTVPLTVVDECGAWPTLVGGGTSAGF
jgi:YVTN family beta-propeller protein